MPLLMCSDQLPKGDYKVLEPEKVNYANHLELKNRLVADGSDFKLSFRFWKIQKAIVPPKYRFLKKAGI